MKPAGENGSVTGSLRDRVGAIRKEMEAVFVEREEAIEALLVAMVAEENVVYLGPPGTAKSALLNGLVACLPDATKFMTLLTRFTGEDEVCGPAKLSALKLDRFERNTVGYLPGADVAFLDEIFKANSAVLNALLSVLNEHTYKGLPCPLRLAVAASNEMPEDESLAALFDRFMVRCEVSYVNNDAAWLKMLASQPRFVPPAQLSLAEWAQIVAEARTIPIPETILDDLVKLRAALREKGVIASDRRWIKSLGLLRAAAWLDGDSVVEPDHLAVVRFALWQKQDQIAALAAVLQGLDMGPVKKAIDVIDATLRKVSEMPRDQIEHTKAVPDMITLCRATAENVVKMKGTLSPRGYLKVKKKMAELEAATNRLKKTLAERYDLGGSAP